MAILERLRSLYDYSGGRAEENKLGGSTWGWGWRGVVVVVWSLKLVHGTLCFLLPGTFRIAEAQARQSQKIEPACLLRRRDPGRI